MSKITLYLSEMVNQLRVLGIVPLAETLAKHGIPLVGRLKHFLSNWHTVTQDYGHVIGNSGVLVKSKHINIPLTPIPSTCMRTLQYKTIMVPNRYDEIKISNSTTTRID